MPQLNAAIKFRWWVPMFVKSTLALAMILGLAGSRLDRFTSWCGSVIVNHGTTYQA